MAKKSNAQIRRMQMRAEKRGEEYVAPEAPPPSDNAKSSDDTPPKKMMTVAQKLHKELMAIQNNDELRAKERRSQKRKAEAIAAEKAGCSAEEMQKWMEENQALLEQQLETAKKDKASNKDSNEEPQPQHTTPYIVFVGQLAYTTTKEALRKHIQTELSSEFEITPETVKIRLLTDAKTKKSRGMAFVELTNPELMYGCLRLHHTLLDGRRLNVERSAGGRKKETRQAKIQEFREKQEEYLSHVVETILGDYIKSGELQEGELDQGAIAMCKRYSAGMVETALKQYIENNGRTMDNTSAYFSFLLSKLASDKAEEQLSENKNNNNRPSKKPRSDNKPKTAAKNNIAPKSKLEGVDWSLSEKKKEDDNSLSKIFPSLARGRGRGRGYM